MDTPQPAIKTEIIPYIFYRDVPAALDWLAHAFGFTEEMRHPTPSGMHAQMRLDGRRIMMGQGSTDWRMQSPGETLSAPRIRIGNPANSNVMTPAATRAFAFVDLDNNHIVDGVSGAGGTFPRFPSSIGPSSTVQAGNQYDRRGNVQANVIVGYFFNTSGNPQFVAFHLFVAPGSNAVTPVSVLYGDVQPGIPGTSVWVSTSVTTSQTMVTQGTATPNTPNRIQGSVTAHTLDSNNTTRIVDFTFNDALIIE